MDKKRLADAAWYADNRDRARANNRAWKANHTEYAAEWRKKHPGYNAERYAANREKRLESAARYARENPEKIRSRGKKYLAENAEKIDAQKALYRAENPNKTRLYNHNRRARKITNGGKLSPDIIETLLIGQRNQCVFCKVDLRSAGFHLDHIYALSRGGDNTDSNVQLLCPPCNHSKGAKDPIDYLLERGILDDVLPPI